MKWILLMIFMIGFASAGIQGQIGLDLNVDPVTSTNTTTQFINNTNHSNSTDYWVTNIGALDDVNSTEFSEVGGVLTIETGWLIALITSTGNALWCELTGCTMTGNINMGGNNITNADVISATTFIGNGSQLTGVSTEGLNNTFNMYFTYSMKNEVIWNFSESDQSVVNITVEPGEHYIFGGNVF